MPLLDSQSAPLWTVVPSIYHVPRLTSVRLTVFLTTVGLGASTGNAQTDMAARLSKGALQPDGRVVPEAMIDVQHVAAAIVHIASLPNDVTVLEMNIM